MILAGDVGGTKVHLALFDFIDGNLKHARDKQFPAKEYAGLEEIVKEFIVSEKVTAACFGVPGPVREGGCASPTCPGPSTAANWPAISRSITSS